MMPDEVANVLQVLRGAFRTKLEADTALVWAKLLEDVEYEHGQEVADLYARTEKFFPSPSEFLASVHEVQRRDAGKRLRDQNIEAAFRCDGSRWRCADHHGKCPDGCETPAGLEPCPTCNAVQYERLKNPSTNALWRSGHRFDDSATLHVPACVPLREPVAYRDDSSKEQLAAADWAASRKDLF